MHKWSGKFFLDRALATLYTSFVTPDARTMNSIPAKVCKSKAAYCSAF